MYRCTSELSISVAIKVLTIRKKQPEENERVVLSFSGQLCNLLEIIKLKKQLKWKGITGWFSVH